MLGPTHSFLYIIVTQCNGIKGSAGVKSRVGYSSSQGSWLECWECWECWVAEWTCAFGLTDPTPLQHRTCAFWTPVQTEVHGHQQQASPPLATKHHRMLTSPNCAAATLRVSAKRAFPAQPSHHASSSAACVPTTKTVRRECPPTQGQARGCLAVVCVVQSQHQYKSCPHNKVPTTNMTGQNTYATQTKPGQAAEQTGSSCFQHSSVVYSSLRPWEAFTLPETSRPLLWLTWGHKTKQGAAAQRGI